MIRKNWKELDKMIGKCYESMIGVIEKDNLWQDTFQLLIKTISEERKKDADFATELYKVGDEIDFLCDVEGWLEDYFDELDMSEKLEEIIESANQLLELFKWEEDSKSVVNHRKASALSRTGRCQEAIALCEEWLKKESDNPLAAASLIYSYLTEKDMDSAEKTADSFWNEELECTFETEPYFTAAATVYGLSDNKVMLEKCKNALATFEEWFKDFYGMDGYNEDDEILF